MGSTGVRAFRWRTPASSPRTGATDYDWRTSEAALNRYAQFTTEIDGLDIHFVHQRSRTRRLPARHHARLARVDRRIRKVIAPLTNPTPTAGVPRMRSTWCARPARLRLLRQAERDRMDTGRIARAWETLMVRLGYDRYGAQGGDWGSAVTTEIGRNVGHCVGILVRGAQERLQASGEPHVTWIPTQCPTFRRSRWSPRSPSPRPERRSGRSRGGPSASPTPSRSCRCSIRSRSVCRRSRSRAGRHTTWNASSARPLAVGLVRGAMTLPNSTIDPGQPCVMTSGRRRVRGALVHEVDVEAVDLGGELRVAVQRGFARAPVVVRRPVRGELAGVRQRMP